MRAPTRPELLLAVLCIVAALLVKAAWGSDAAKEAELVLAKAETVELRDSLARVNEETDVLRREKADADLAAADSLAVLTDVIADAEHRAETLAISGRETFAEIIEAVPDSLPELRDLIERREQLHETEVAVLREVIAGERSASGVLRGQLTTANALIRGQDIELGVGRALIESLESEVEILEDLRSPGLSTREAASISVNAYFVSTQALGASTLEGLLVGGATFVVLEGGSMLLGWIF
ncbi:MAG: hypothetical protein V3T08_09570 [Gemmatimonadota bacterium]